MKIKEYVEKYTRGLSMKVPVSFIDKGWVNLDGRPTNEGVLESGLPYLEWSVLVLGSVVKVRSMSLDADNELPIIWRGESGGRKWFRVILKDEQGRGIPTVLWDSPNHRVEKVLIPNLDNTD